MKAAPERIKLRYYSDKGWVQALINTPNRPPEAKYIRADIAEAENKRLRKGLKRLQRDIKTIQQMNEQTLFLLCQRWLRIIEQALKGNQCAPS